MKKQIGILAVTLLAVSAFAQGTITMGNLSTTTVKKWTSATDSTLVNVPLTATSGAYVQFLAAPTGTSLTPLGTLGAGGFTASYTTLASFLAANPLWNAYTTTGISPAAGRFQGGTVTVTPLSPGGTIEYIMIGWTGGATLDAAIAAGGMIGQSALVTGIATGNPNTSPPGTATLMNASFGGMTLAPLVTGPVPEPSTFALAGLGAAALLIFRRRK